MIQQIKLVCLLFVLNNRERLKAFINKKKEKMIKKVFISCILLLGVQMSYSQVGIGTSTPDNSSVLEVSSTSKGVLFPRMTTAQRDAMVNPAKGLTIYNLDEDCLQINFGTTNNSDWSCVNGLSSSTVDNDCDSNGFEGVYVNGVALTTSNKFSVTITNNSFNTVDMNFSTDDLELSGVNGLSVNSVNLSSATIIAGSSQIIEYSLTGTPVGTGVLTGVWTKLGLNCTKTINITHGDARFILPQIVTVISVNDGISDVQGKIDNGVNQLTVSIPYTEGVGGYDAYNGVYTLNNIGTSEGGDANSFRLTYPSGTFSASGEIIATIEVDGDGSFDVKKLLYGVQETIVALGVYINGNYKGNVNIDGIGLGILDRNFADPDHKFVYTPITAADGRVWLNNNLGANYANMNHSQFNPNQQATSYDDHHAYGSLYQWGRYSDGHELINWTNSSTGTAVNGTTSTNATSDTPGNNLFIIENFYPYDWRNPQNDNLWQGESGPNNPCPEGYRIPTLNELQTLLSTESITDVTTAFGSTLAFSASGFRNDVDGVLTLVGSYGNTWSSTVTGVNSKFTNYSIGGFSSNNSDSRAHGITVRCIKNE